MTEGRKYQKAFPIRTDILHNGGMTLRDYFAGQALALVVVRGNWPDEATARDFATEAYHIADAMLEEGVV